MYYHFAFQFLILFLIISTDNLSLALDNKVQIDNLIRLDIDNLSYTKNNLSNPKSNKNIAVAQLENAAKYLLTIKPFSVVNKKVLPASGNAHDYFSFAPYWWPNPETDNGLPWIKLDGKINPASRGEFTDKTSYNNMIDAVQTLTLAYYFTDKSIYSDKAVSLIVAWFVTEDTKMNPHLKYAQSIPGVSEGRGIGIIDTRGLYRILDCLVILKKSGSLNEENNKLINQWFSEFLTWLVTSQLGADEMRMENNHGTFYDLQVGSIAKYLGKLNILKDSIERTKNRIDQQINENGEQIKELSRTRPFHYSVFNLQAFFGMAALSKSIGYDLWEYRSNKKLKLRESFSYIEKRLTNESNWGGSEERIIDKSIIIPLVVERSTKELISVNGYIGDSSDLSVFIQCSLIFNKDIKIESNSIDRKDYQICRY